MKIFVKSPDKLREFVYKTGYTFKEFSDKCNIHHTTFSKVLNGKQSISPSTAKRIADALGYEIEHLFTFRK